jgi:hypothetical protein
MTQKQNTPDKEDTDRQARMKYIKTKRPFGPDGIASKEIVETNVDSDGTPTNPPPLPGKSPDGKKGWDR